LQKLELFGGRFDIRFGEEPLNTECGHKNEDTSYHNHWDYFEDIISAA
jgi:hypothetical protein